METPLSAIVEFDTDDYEFERGLHMGVLYGVLASRPDLEIHFLIARTNVENMLRICEALSRPFAATGKECKTGCHLEFSFPATLHAKRE